MKLKKVKVCYSETDATNGQNNPQKRNDTFHNFRCSNVVYVVGGGVFGYIEIYGIGFIDMVLRDDGCHDDVSLITALAECVLVGITSGTDVGRVTLLDLFQCGVRCTVLETDYTVGEFRGAYLCLGAYSIVQILCEESGKENRISHQLIKIRTII